MSKHTPGPWTIKYGYVFGGDITVAKVLQSTGPADEYEDRTPIENHEANAERIVACVNAMEGIEDPGSFVEHARRMVSGIARADAAGDLTRSVREAGLNGRLIFEGWNNAMVALLEDYLSVLKKKEQRRAERDAWLEQTNAGQGVDE